MKNYVNSINNFWLCLTSIGMTGDVDEKDRKYIKFTNVIAVLTALAVFVYIPFSIIQGSYMLAGLQTVDTFCILTVLLFNYWGYHKASRHLYILIINIFVLINSCLIGFESRVHDFFYIVYIVPFLFFSVKDYRNIMVGVLTSVLFFNIYQAIYPRFEIYNLDAGTQHMIYSINLWMKFVLFGIAIYILSYYNYTTESELAASNLKLEEQAKELQRSNSDLEQFASIISHDLKAPVKNVSSFMGLMLKRYGTTLDKDATSFIELSKNSADRMSRQIDDVLSYSKVGRNLPSAGSVDVSALIATIQIELGEKIRDKNTVIIIENQLPVLRLVHSSMIHHIFQNLIANAIKFNSDDRPVVAINCQSSGGYYIFCIRDNGIGIDEIYRDKLFQMFKRLHSDQEFEGTGIGLAVCKKIVDFYGGRIWFESEKGKGTSFFFTLPHYRTEPSKVYSAKFPAITSSHSLSLS